MATNRPEPDGTTHHSTARTDQVVGNVVAAFTGMGFSGTAGGTRNMGVSAKEQDARYKTILIVEVICGWLG